jgi:hypothetical protein
MGVVRLKVQKIEEAGAATRVIVLCTYDKPMGKLTGDTLSIRGNDATQYCDLPGDLPVDRLSGLVANELEIRVWEESHGGNWSLDGFLRDKMR